MIYPYNGTYPDIHPSVFLTDDCVIVGDVTIGEDASVWFGAVVRADINAIRIGARTNVQDNAVLHVTQDEFAVTVGEDVTIGHGAIIHGCTVRDGSLIGMGATLLDGAVIGAEALVAAGTLVRQGFVVPDGALVAGVPGTVVRMLSATERASLRDASEHYLRAVIDYRRSGDLGRGIDMRTYLDTIRGGR